MNAGVYKFRDYVSYLHTSFEWVLLSSLAIVKHEGSNVNFVQEDGGFTHEKRKK